MVIFFSIEGKTIGFQVNEYAVFITTGTNKKVLQADNFKKWLTLILSYLILENFSVPPIYWILYQGHLKIPGKSNAKKS